MSDEIQHRDPHRLARLLDADTTASGKWLPSELCDILRHQLDTPLVVDLAGAGAEAGLAGRAAGSFRELFNHPRPPLELLRLAKEFAKASDRRPQSPLPSEVATMMYYGAIITADLRHGVIISDLTPDELRRGVLWAVEQPGIDPDIEKLMKEWLINRGGGDGNAGGEVVTP